MGEDQLVEVIIKEHLLSKETLVPKEDLEQATTPKNEG